MSRRIMFYDDVPLACRNNLELVPGPVEKTGIVPMETISCELQRASVFAGSVVVMPKDGYRLYYSGNTPDGKGLALAFAESGDGLHWKKPLLGQMHWEGQDTNWLWPQGMPEGARITQPQVILLPDGSWRMWFWWHGHDVGRMPYVAAESEDGINWRVIDLDMPHIMHPADRELGQNALVAGLTAASAEDRFAHIRTMDWMEAKRLRSNDATYVYYNDKTGHFEMYSVWLLPVDEATGRMTPHDNAPRVLRTIHRRESADGIAWSDPEMIIMADEHDPLHQQFYYLAVQPDIDWNLGFLGHYRCWEQTMDIELCFSRDTHHWIRPLRGGFVPRGTFDETDYMSAYATNRLIDEGDTWFLLYRGGNAMHNHKLPPCVSHEQQATMGARFTKGRLAGLRATERMVGSLTLKRFNHCGSRITVDADIRGRLQAELRDPYGRPLPGYELNSCVIATGDSARHVLTWENGRTTADYRYDVASLRLEIENGIVYSITI